MTTPYIGDSSLRQMVVDYHMTLSAISRRTGVSAKIVKDQVIRLGLEDYIQANVDRQNRIRRPLNNQRVLRRKSVSEGMRKDGVDATLERVLDYRREHGLL